MPDLFAAAPWWVDVGALAGGAFFLVILGALFDWVGDE